MTRRYLLVALAGFASFAFAQTDPLPKAETILDHYVEVTGGKGHTRSVRTRLLPALWKRKRRD
jgi:hypothetical protein